MTSTANRNIHSYGYAMTLAEVAEYLKISTKLASRLLKKRELAGVKVGRSYRISRASVLALINGKRGTKENCVVSVTSNPKDWTSGKKCGIVCATTKTEV